MKKVPVFLLCFLLHIIALSQKTIRLTSPDKKIAYTFKLKKDKPVYSISYGNTQLIEDATLSLSFIETGEFSQNLRVLKPVYAEAIERYELVVGKNRMVSHPYKEIIIPLEEKSTPFRLVHLIVRAFNDGIAFRYVFPEQKRWLSYTLTDERSGFKFTMDPKMLALLLPNFTTSHEGEYSSMLLSELKNDTLVDMPALFEFPGSIYLAITEASLVDYAGMYLTKRDGELTSVLSPLPGQDLVPANKIIRVQARLPHQTPWRVVMIGDRIGSLIESNIITSLNAPCKIDDVSWIKPGKTTFPWWNGSIIPDTAFAPGNNFENNQYYIDFCARNGIEYHTVVESNGHEWYTNDGEGYQPGRHADVTRPVPGIDMKQICDYAKSKGVMVRVWVHWKALYPKLDTAFAMFEQWGLSGMMVDFMDRDDQEMIRIKEEILQKAAKHRLHIQWHGVEKPTGLSRTYPNEITREGTLNYEVNKWDKRVTPGHDLNIVFTRMLAGPADYHMGGFRAVPDSAWKVQFTRPLMMGTRCHMLGMYVVLETYLNMVCDYPAAYEGQPGFGFVKKVPTTWDETRVVEAVVGEYILIARRKGNDWFVGAINNHQAREITFSLDFLGNGEFDAYSYTEAADVQQFPNHIVEDTMPVTKSNRVTFHMAAGSGAAFHLKKK